MGSPVNELGRIDNETRVDVVLTHGFWLGKYELTQEQWRVVMHTEPWAGKDYVTQGNRYPAVFVSWSDAVSFCDNLTQLERRAGRLPADWKYTLPTEAQWEYACRAESTSMYSCGDGVEVLSRFAWFDGMSASAEKVGEKKSNPWNLSDMHGNVYEWCRDVYNKELVSGIDPERSAGGVFRVLRGGAWNISARDCRSAFRLWDKPAHSYSFVGFRVAAVRCDD